MQIYNVQKVKRAWIGGAGKSRHVGYVTLGNCIEIAKKNYQAVRSQHSMIVAHELWLSQSKHKTYIWASRLICKLTMVST